MTAPNNFWLCTTSRRPTTIPNVLEKIWQFDIGFFFASLAQVEGSPAENKYFQVLDLKNPFGAGGP